MNFVDAGIQLIEEFEGFRSNSYPDAGGVWTIGYGTTFYPNGTSVKSTDAPITQEQAESILMHNLQKFKDAVANGVTSKLNDNQYSALVCFTYNVGAANLAHSTLLKKVNENPDDPTIRDEFLRWDKCAGKTLNGLLRRREAESNLYFTEPD